MKRSMAWGPKTSVVAAGLALCLAAGGAPAQSYGSYYGSGDQSGYDQDRYDQGRYDQGTYNQPGVDRYRQDAGAKYDYARVLRVDPVIVSGNDRYAASDYRNCTTVSSPRYGGYTSNDGYYGNDGYRNDGYRNDPYGNDGNYGNQGYGNQDSGNNAGRTVATVIGGVIGAAIGSQVGGGSARYATSAIGSMVGGIAGRQVYESSHQRRGIVRACDPVPVGRGNADYYGAGAQSVSAYNVTYEYAGRTYTTLTNYNPGNRIRVRVDVRPD